MAHNSFKLTISFALVMTLSTEAWSGNKPAHTHSNVTTINGQLLPVDPFPLQNVTVMLDTFDSHGNRLIITRGTRKAQTRAAIHVHMYGGHTCVLSGEITIFMECVPPAKKPSGTCYYMPPNVPMTATNLGTEDVELTDTFVLPPGADTLTALERKAQLQQWKASSRQAKRRKR